MFISSTLKDLRPSVTKWLMTTTTTAVAKQLRESPHSSCSAYMSRTIWSGRRISKRFRQKVHQDRTSWSNWNVLVLELMTYSASITQWYIQFWSMPAQFGISAWLLHCHGPWNDTLQKGHEYYISGSWLVSTHWRNDVPIFKRFVTRAVMPEFSCFY